MTILLSGLPCIGKTTLGNSNKLKYMDLEFRETASTRGMSNNGIDILYDSYLRIVQEIIKSNYYAYLMVTDNPYMIDRLIQVKLPFTYVVPRPTDTNYIYYHKSLVLKRNDITWYNTIIKPRLHRLDDEIHRISNSGNTIKFLTLDKPFISNVL